MQMCVAIQGRMGPMTLWKPPNRSGGLGISWGRTVYVVHFSSSMYTRYTSDTRCVTAPQSYTALQRYTALHSAIHYTAIHRYTVYNLYNTPLRRGCL